MKSKSLFKVLVISGAALTSGYALAETEIAEDAPVVVEENQAGALTFCNSKDEAICVVSVVDNQCQLAPREGLVCCWGTTCAE